MKQSFWFAASVHARAGDRVHIFITTAPGKSDLGRWLGFKRQLHASRSPFVYNESSKAWFMTHYHAVITDEMLLAPSSSPKVYEHTPDPALIVAKVIYGEVLGSAVIRRISDEDSGLDSRLDVDVLSERTIAQGESWLPDTD
ncbi:hypothetical protein [Brevundimonas diminuta]|uniref:hypothetical protein n=1 Tax=Brevundimonas diminuta TaxID=293 RepID=UPI003208E50C